MHTATMAAIPIQRATIRTSRTPRGSSTVALAPQQQQQQQKQQHGSRRGLLLAALAAPLALAAVPRAARAEEKAQGNKEIESSESPLIQELLERSRANKERYDRERLDDYYRRNFSDYFGYIEGSGGGSGASAETKASIRRWMEANVEANEKKGSK